MTAAGREIPQVRRLDTAERFAAHLESLGVDLPFDEHVAPGSDGVLGRPFEVAGRQVGNRFAVLPMEGWDGTADGRPTELVRRRWRRFGRSGAKLILGCEAVAVSDEGGRTPTSSSPPTTPPTTSPSCAA